MSKKLQTCSRCGARNLVNIKSHKCKGTLVSTNPGDPSLFENLGPRDQKKLNECASNIARVYGAITAKTRKFHDGVIYDIVEVGLYFLQAKAAIGHGEFTDFVKLETVANLNVSDRSTRNYMNAARNAGLTEKSTAADVKKLRAKKALHGRKPTELYALTDGNEGDDDDVAPSKWSLMRDTAISVRDACDAAIQMRSDMNKKAFETICARLHRTLEEISGSDWDMVQKRKTQHFKEHGDIYELGS